jgi:hypothetical protein
MNIDLESQRVRHVDRLDDLAGLVDEAHGKLAHLADRLVQLLRNGDVGVATARALGDVLGQVAHALEGGADPEGTDEGAQLSRDGGLQGDDVESEDLERIGTLVDVDVAGDDRLGGLQVGIEECPRGSPHGVAHHLGHLDEAFADLGQLFVILLAHGHSVGGRP